MKRKILVANLLIVSGIVMACGSAGKDQKIKNEEISQESENTEEVQEDTTVEDSVNMGEDVSNSSDRKEYKNGDVIEFTSGLKVTIVDSGVYSKPDLLDSNKVEKYAFLEVDMENTGNENIAITGSLFQFYADGYALKNTYLYEDAELPLASDLSPGRKVKGRVYATGENIDSSERIEAELSDAVIRIYEYDDYAEENVMEDFCGMFESIDGYVYAMISPTNDYGIVEVVLGSLEYDEIEYDFYANLKENGNDCCLVFNDNDQIIEISKEYIEEYDSDGIYICGCERRTYNNLYVRKGTLKEDSDLNAFLGALYTVYGGDEHVNLYIDDAGKLCVWNGYVGGDEPYYEQTYDAYSIDGDTLYGHAGDFVDEFVFEGDGLVEVLFSGDGSTHYQTYIREEEYFSTDWRKAHGFE